MKTQNLIITRCKPSGLSITAMINGYRVQHYYVGYTVKEATALFLAKYSTH